MAEPQLSYADLARIADLVDDAQGYAHFHFAHGGIEIELRRHAPGVASGAPAPSAPLSIASREVGIFRAAVGVGGRVEAGAAIGHVEVLGEARAVSAPVAAVVAEFCVADGVAVEYGQALAIVKPEA